MSRTGRLLRQARAQERECAACGHAVSAHREREREDPRYRPALFVCGQCPCEVQG